MGEETKIPVELEADVKLQAVKEIGEVSLSITDLGVAATVFVGIIIAVVFLVTRWMKSNDRREERGEEKWVNLHSQVIQVVKENTTAQNNAAAAIKDNASATRAIEDLVRNMELERLRALQSQSSSQDARSSQAKNTPGQG